MNAILFRLGGVPEDEIDEIRALLEADSIDFFETEPRLFGISPPAIWVRDREQLDRGRALIGQYQVERSKRVRDEHDRALHAGDLPTLRDRLLAHPFRTLLYVALAALVLFFTVMPFIWLQ